MSQLLGDLLDTLEGLNPTDSGPWVQSRSDCASCPERATEGGPDGAEPRAHRRRRPSHQAGGLRAARPGRVRLLEAADGQAALEWSGVERPDLVILDLTMPRLDGLRACAALRSDPELAGTRVLVLTGRDQPDDRAAARDAGADAYLVKPFSSLALLEAVKRLTDG